MATNASRTGTAAVRSPVVVGFDGSPAALRAVEWATDEAVARGTPLQVVHVVAEIDHPAFRAGGLRYHEAHRALETAREVARARSVNIAGANPPVIETTVVRGRPDQVLIGLSRSAGLLALGAGTTGLLSRIVLGSTALAVTKAAHCPVALVPRSGAHPGTVLVIADTPATAKPALREAFRAAHGRGDEITVMRVRHGRTWGGDKTATPPGTVVPDADIAACGRDHPAIAVRLVTVVGDPMTAVERFSATACLIVVAHEDESGHLGAITQELVRHAPCPVLVAPGHRTGTSTRPLNPTLPQKVSR